MNWRIGQYLEFENKIGRITNIDKDEISIRYFSYGNTEKGYSYQGRKINKKILNKLFSERKIATISPESIMELLLNKLIEKKT